MNRELVESILGVIKTSSDKAVVVKGLLKLRTDLVKDLDGIILFREAGGVTPMVRFLNKPHEQILEIVLSILGNCCTDEASCKEALDCRVSVALATILKSIPNPIIQCRACRLLGNLAKCDVAQLLATHCPAIAQSVCQIIEETTDVQTRMMAFRACRFLLANPQFLKHFVINHGFVILLRLFAAVMKNDAVVPEESIPIGGDCSPPLMGGLKKNQHREKYFEEVARNLEGVRSDIFDHEVLKNSPRTSNAYAMPEKAALDLAYEILKCLLVMSELHMNYTVWSSLNRSASTFAPIVFFAGEENKHRSGALKILSNFSKNQGAFYILSSADAIVAACELLVAEHMKKTLTESEVKSCINLIYMLSTDACNRSKIRRSGAISKLIAMIRNSESQTEISSILYILNNFQYDNLSLDLMLKDGLIPVLIKELNAYLIGDDDYHKKKREEKQQTAKKRKLPDQASESLCKLVKIREEPAIDCESPSSSPRSYISPSSPCCSSRSLSPVTNLFKLNEEAGSDDETYSPICSDDEGDDDDEDAPLANNEAANITANTVDNSDIMKLLDIACRTEPIEDNMLDKEDDDEISQDVIAPKLPQLGNLPPSTIDIIENLLFRATLQVNKRGELGKPETMNTLIKAINIFGANNNFAASLTTILLESQFFAHVIKQGIAHRLFQLTKTEEMRRDGLGFLETLTNVGESNYGKAELARLLRSPNDVDSDRAAIAVAYIIRSHRVLFQFLNDGSALAQLLNIILRGKRDEYTAEAVDALTFMCQHTLEISVPQISVKRAAAGGECGEFVEDEKAELHRNCDMRFLVHECEDSAKPQTKVGAAPVVIGFNKQLLCDSSEVFNTMLNSDFREGHEGEIHLRSYTPSGLRYFLNLIVLQSQQLTSTIPPPHQYHALIEAFEMSRIYIIPTLEQFLQKMLIGLLDASNCLSVLEWAMKNYHAELTEMAINYYLCSTLSTEAKVELFRSADYSTYSSEWFQMIFDAVFVRCRNGF